MRPALPELTLAVEAAAVVVMTVSGMITAARARMDLIGTFTLALVTAFGGGTLRDLILERRPLFWVANEGYVFGTLLLCLAFVYSRRAYATAAALDRKAVFVDALGLALFSLTGVRYALEAGLPRSPRRSSASSPGRSAASCATSSSARSRRSSGPAPSTPPRRSSAAGSSWRAPGSRCGSRSPTPRGSPRSSSSGWPRSASACAFPTRTGSGRRATDPTGLLRELRLLDEEAVGVARPEVAVDGDDPLREDDVAHRHGILRRHGQVVVLPFGGPGAVAKVEPVLPHDPQVHLDDLPAHRDRLPREGGTLREELRDRASFRALGPGDGDLLVP